MELSNFEAVRQEAIISSAEMVRGLGGAQFWSGEPWMLRVTDQPNGGGETILAITFASAAH